MELFVDIDCDLQALLERPEQAFANAYHVPKELKNAHSSTFYY